MCRREAILVLKTKGHIGTGGISILKLLRIGNFSICTFHRSKFTPPAISEKPHDELTSVGWTLFFLHFKERQRYFSHTMLPHSKINTTSCRRSKRMHISPKEGSNKCLSCNIALEDDSHAILCDECDKWICIECLDMPEPEYLLITKISWFVDICIKCPACKYPSTSVNTQYPSVQNILQATINSMKNEILDKIPSQVAFQEIVHSSLKYLEISLKAEISQTIGKIKSQISALET